MNNNATVIRLLARRLFRPLLLVALPWSALPAAADETRGDHWWSGITFTPGAGWRALNIDMHAASGAANLQTDFGSSLFASLDIEVYRYPFGDSGFALSLLGHTATVRANEQWVKDASGAGSRESLGTGISGHYSYLAPALSWGARQPDGSGLELSVGVGRWSGEFSGDAVFAADYRADASLPSTPVSVRFDEWGYDTRLTLYLRHWALVMTVGGPFPFKDGGTKYEFQQVALILGYEIRLK
jgi:hypothetical protein